MSAPRANAKIALVKFGTKFGPGYVNRAARAVADHLTRPHEVVCVTDDPRGLDPAIVVKPVPDFGLPREKWTHRGNWPKIALFHPAMFDDDDLVLYLDLDLFVFKSLEPFFERLEDHGGFHELREWNPTLWRALPLRLRPDRGAQGSVFCFRAREQRHVWTHFTNNADAIVEGSWGDRAYWTKIAWAPRYLPEGWIASFKRHCVLYYPLSLLRPEPKKPDWARILVFHGHPTPDALADPKVGRWGRRRRGWGPVPWIVDYFKKYGG